MSNKSHCVDRYKTHSDKSVSVERWYRAVVAGTHDGTILCKDSNPRSVHISAQLSPLDTSVSPQVLMDREDARKEVLHTGIPNSAQALLIAQILVLTQSNYLRAS